MNRTQKQFANLGIDSGKHFLDNDLSGMQERLDMLMALRPGDTVVLLDRSDLGVGRAQSKAVAAIEETGAVIEVADQSAPKGKGGRPSPVDWTDENLARALLIWSALPEPEALAMIKKEMGIVTDRNHMNYQRRKQARDKLNLK